MTMAKIQNRELLTEIFGSWPSFHDAEILSIQLDRGGEDGPSLTAVIHLWRMTNEVDANGYIVCKNYTLATLRFGHILLEMLNGFNHQNVLSELSISTIDSNISENDHCSFGILMETSYGCQAMFKCRSITVLKAEPHSVYPA